ncbi:MAG: HAMP domain-containing histidine kinase [Leucobacter sp.]|nr:HAMP domain-containing histidine kinase [Leucobacter sp.]
MKRRTVWTRRSFRLTIRARITLSVALLVALGGGIIVAGLNVFMRFGPVWALPASEALISPDAMVSKDNSAPAQTYEPGEDGWQYTDDLHVTLPSLQIRDATDVFDTLLWSSIVALAVIVVLGALAAWLLAGRLLAPLQTINEAARAATPSKLDRRVGLRGPRDELTELSDTFDEMLERLERAFRAQQLFAANASHELRTPLATEKAMLDMLLDGPEPSLAEYREVAERLREVNARSIAMGEALLELTRSQMGLGEQSRRGSASHEVNALLAEPLARCRETAAGRGLAVVVEVSPHAITANPAMLGRLLDNLLGNAARHAFVGAEVPGKTRSAREQHLVTSGAAYAEPSGARAEVADPLPVDPIHISWKPDGDESVLRVRNTSLQLDTETRERLTEPFVRAGGRVRAETGSGLGLAIAVAVAHAHGGTLRLREPDRDGAVASGLEDFTVEVRLPR